MPKQFAMQRFEARVPMTLAVNISNQQQSAGVETTFTENVSAHGARILSTRHWRPGRPAVICIAARGFSCERAGVYCRPQRNHEFAVGIEFLEPVARWLLSPPGSGDNLHG